VREPAELVSRPQTGVESKTDVAGELPAAGLELIDLTKAFDRTHRAVVGLNLHVKRGEFFTLLGPSGSGKSTTLNLIAGFIRPDRGDIRVAGRSITSDPPERRNVSVVFQSYALFPHMSIFDNVAFPLRRQRVRGGDLNARVMEALELVGLESRPNAKPGQLSGGQRQRAALARALVGRPEIVLLDEPLGALDRRLRQYLQEALRELHGRVGFTAVYVTHDQEEALVLSDRVGIMSEGALVQIATGEELYTRPASLFVANFLGDANVFEGLAVSAANLGLVEVRLPASQSVLTVPTSHAFAGGDRALVVARPENLELVPPVADHELGRVARGTVRERMFLGQDVVWVVDQDEGREVRIRERPTDAKDFEVGDRVVIHLREKSIAVAVPSDE
jgi:ABC-type Fe3+/spermidine/putrescine transport system ATPase subunit